MRTGLGRCLGLALSCSRQSGRWVLLMRAMRGRGLPRGEPMVATVGYLQVVMEAL